MSETIELPMLEDGSVAQLEMVEVLKKMIVLQDQFNQLTHHVQECYRRIEALHKIISNKVLS